MFVSTYTLNNQPELEQKTFNVYIDVDYISTIESATRRSNIIVKEVLGEQAKNYQFTDIVSMTQEEFYAAKGVEDDVPEVVDTDEDAEVVVAANE